MPADVGCGFVWFFLFFLVCQKTSTTSDRCLDDVLRAEQVWFTRCRMSRRWFVCGKSTIKLRLTCTDLQRGQCFRCLFLSYDFLFCQLISDSDESQVSPLQHQLTLRFNLYDWFALQPELMPSGAATANQQPALCNPLTPANFMSSSTTSINLLPPPATNPSPPPHSCYLCKWIIVTWICEYKPGW